MTLNTNIEPSSNTNMEEPSGHAAGGTEKTQTPEDGVEHAAALPPELKGRVPSTADELFKLKGEDVWSYFESYDLTPLGTFHHHKKFQEGFEALCIITHFAKLYVVRLLLSGSPKFRNSRECQRMGVEWEMWQSSVYEIETKRANFDTSKAAEFRTEDRVKIVFEPKKGACS